jgi:tetratricopeptide (TPR) repeat protein
MWPAADAAGWAKPVLLTWQRTWDDAVAVAKETKRPILVCINMDGEIASEHYAGVRYRSEEIAPLYEPYVLVIASVYRHNPRDHDDEGRRIPCPRFGGVTCGEHIAIEPVIYEKFCDGQRIAPRHILVEVDGKETFDVFYRNDTASVFEDIKKAIADRPPLPPRPVRSDRPVVERVASREVTDRLAVEAAYAKADPAARKALLEAAVKHPEAAPLDLLRLAVFGLDVEASRTARQALAKVDDPAATTLVADALRVPMDAAERQALIAALDRLGGRSELAKWLAVLHKGLGARSSAVDPAAWAAGAGAGAGTSSPVDEAPSARVMFAASAAKARPDDPAPRLDLAEASLAVAQQASRPDVADRRLARLVARAAFEDARRFGLEAERLGAKGWRLDAVLALAAYHGGDVEEGYARAAAAAKALPAGEGSFESMAVLTIFAEGRWYRMKKAVKEKKEFPPEWLADVNAAYAILLKHPWGTDGQVLWHEDTLDWLGAHEQAERVLREGLARFRDSEGLHERLRQRTMRRRGVGGAGGLEATYDAMAKAEGASPSLPWFAGLASSAVADQRRRRGAYDEATAAYGRAIAHFDRATAATPWRKEAADRAAALAHAGRARVALQTQADDAALAEILAAFARSPSSATTTDGMGITPLETAQSLLARLKAANRADAAARLDAAIAALDPESLRGETE